MGCDIHFYVEVKNTNGAWESAHQLQTDEDGYTSVPYPDRFYTGRNYDLFAMLADVRNGRGFAGIDTGDGFKPIDKPRGVPSDASDVYKAEVKRWHGDGHSHSYFTLAEMQAYDWQGQKTNTRGVVSAAEYVRWKKSGDVFPQFWCGATSMPTVKESAVEGFSLDEIIKRYGEDANIACEWQVTYYQTASDFVDGVLPKMAALHSDPASVRACFFFDN